MMITDASAVVAVVVGEPAKEPILSLTRDQVLLAPEMVSFEVGNALIRLYKRHSISTDKIFKAYNEFLEMPIRLVEVDVKRALEIAYTYNIYAYDAYYLELALGVREPLLTLDTTMQRIGKELGLTILGEKI